MHIVQKIQQQARNIIKKWMMKRKYTFIQMKLQDILNQIVVDFFTELALYKGISQYDYDNNTDKLIEYLTHCKDWEEIQ